MKAVLTEERFSDPAWVFERKLDGIRCIAIKSERDVRLLSRNDLSLNERFPEVAAALAADPATNLILDGEVVAFAGGKTSFEILQQRGERHVSVFLYAFDLLHLAGHDTTALPLHARRRLLRKAVGFHGPLRLTPSRKRDGERFYADACRQGWEGLIAKRADAPYTHGRSRDWLKFKCSAEQELVIGGYTAPRGSRSHLGALLLGYYEDGRLRYAGKVGHRLHRGDAGRPLGAAGAVATRHDAVRRARARAARHLGRAPSRGAGRLQRVDARRPPAPSPLPGAA